MRFFLLFEGLTRGDVAEVVAEKILDQGANSSGRSEHSDRASHELKLMQTIKTTKIVFALDKSLD